MTSNTVNQLQTWSNLYLIGTQNKQTFIYYDIVSIYKMKDKTLFENFTLIPLALYIYIYIYVCVCMCVSLQSVKSVQMSISYHHKTAITAWSSISTGGLHVKLSNIIALFTVHEADGAVLAG